KGMYSDEVYIYDEAGKDTYNAKGSYDKKTKTTNWVEDVYIDDYGNYQDTYNMQYVDYFDIYDYGNTKDIYNIKSSWGWIQDYGGSDVYNIGKLIDSNCRIRIIDTDGDNDILNLSAMKKNNVVLMTDISSGNDFCNNSLIIYDKNSQTFVYIEDFYADENNDGYLDLSGFGVGHIETIKAGGKKLDTNNGDIAYVFDTIRQDVASWLANNTSFSSIQELLRDGTDEQRAYLAAVFENAQSMI
ncbi:MAG: hypothetical protein II085_00210, partial [Alphaproteobacteria bacterium]|nr:hypothetical protein [Alphaproteobacteria bacterium]